MGRDDVRRVLRTDQFALVVFCHDGDDAVLVRGDEIGGIGDAGAGAYGAFGAYWAVFLLGCLPLILVLNQVTQQAVPRYPRIVDAVLGFVFGLVSSTILVCCVMTSLSVIAPKIWEPYNPDALTVRFDQKPIEIYQYIENAIGVKANDPGRTRFPTFDKADQDDFQKYWK